MTYTISSLITTLVSVTIATVFIGLLLKTKKAYRLFRTNLLIGLSGFVVIRLCLPCELWFMHTIASRRILPPIYDGLDYGVHIAPHQSIKLVMILAALWACGSVLRVLRLSVRYVRICRIISAVERHDVAFTTGNLSVVQIEGISSPFTIGLWHPKVVLPSYKLSDDVLNDAIEHEKQHISLHDNAVKMLLQVLCCIYWWFPPVYYFSRQVELLMELRVDERVGMHRSEREKLGYLNSLISVEREMQFSQQGLVKEAPVSCFSTLKEDNLSRRIEFMVSGFGFKRTNRLVLVMAILVPLMLSAFIVEPFRENPSQTKGTQEFDVNGYIIHEKNGAYVLVQYGKPYARFKSIDDPLFKGLKVIEH